MDEGTINLSNRNLNGEDVANLTDILMDDNVFWSLDLSDNAIITEIISCFQSNVLGIKEMQMIAEMLKNNSTLESLDLNSNEIGAEGARMLGEGLKVNSTLINLNLNSNQIGAEGVRMIVEGLKSNSSLVSLDLGKNKISDEVKKELGI